MASDTAKAVAHEVIANLRKPTAKRKSKKQILAERGYAPSVQDHPDNVTETESYKSVMDPYLNRLVAMRNKILAAMSQRDLKYEAFYDLSNSLHKITHDIQLLSGGSTENVMIGVKKLSDDELERLTQPE